MEFAISRTKRPYEFNMAKSHDHPVYELFYLISGHCKIFINHTLYYVEPGDVILIKPEQIHRSTYHSSPVNERVAIHFSREYLETMAVLCGEKLTEYLFRNTKITVPVNDRPYVDGLMQRMEYEQGGKDGFSPLMQKNYLYELLIFLSRCQDTESSNGKLEVSEKAIEDAAQYIYSNFTEQLSLDEVAERAHMSPAYFSRKFKAVTGFGYKEYLSDLRIREASSLLLYTKDSITEIAQKCGFGDGNYFGDAFRKAKGVSPRQFRRCQGARELS